VNQFDIYSDFDGTITEVDTTDFLLGTLADPRWREIEAEWEAGKIGSRECMAAQVGLIRGGWKAIKDALADVKFDPTFYEFADWCSAERIPLRIVSDGMDKVIHYMLDRENIVVDSIVANRLIELPNGQLKLEFPYGSTRNHCTSGVCKTEVLDARGFFGWHGFSHTNKVVIGDGKSDFCWAPAADVLFAKHKLLKHCASIGISCHSYDNFSDVQSILEQQLMPAPLPAYQPALARAFTA
jgi:2,3-diketo-5-methylthio-1-phosphopentane phosphatase